MFGAASTQLPRVGFKGTFILDLFKLLLHYSFKLFFLKSGCTVTDF